MARSGNRAPRTRCRPDRRERIRPGRELAIGSAWMIAMRWAIRERRPRSARSFWRGCWRRTISAWSRWRWSAVAILQSFAQSGSDLALLRMPKRRSASTTTRPGRWKSSREPCWRSPLLVHGAAGLRAVFQDPRVDEVIRVLALAAFVGGFQNIGVVNFRRKLRFRARIPVRGLQENRDFRRHDDRRDRHAQLLGAGGRPGGGRIVEVVLSYVMSDYRPRFSLAQASVRSGDSRAG